MVHKSELDLAITFNIWLNLCLGLTYLECMHDNVDNNYVFDMGKSMLFCSISPHIILPIVLKFCLFIVASIDILLFENSLHYFKCSMYVLKEMHDGVKGAFMMGYLKIFEKSSLSGGFYKVTHNECCLLFNFIDDIYI